MGVRAPALSVPCVGSSLAMACHLLVSVGRNIDLFCLGQAAMPGPSGDADAGLGSTTVRSMYPVDGIPCENAWDGGELRND